MNGKRNQLALKFKMIKIGNSFAIDENRIESFEINERAGVLAITSRSGHTQNLDITEPAVMAAYKYLWSKAKNPVAVKEYDPSKEAVEIIDRVGEFADKGSGQNVAEATLGAQYDSAHLIEAAKRLSPKFDSHSHDAIRMIVSTIYASRRHHPFALITTELDRRAEMKRLQELAEVQ